MGNQGSIVSPYGQRRPWSDWAGAKADLSFRWMNRSLCLFCHAPAHLCPHSPNCAKYGEITVVFDIFAFGQGGDDQFVYISALLCIFCLCSCLSPLPLDATTRPWSISFGYRLPCQKTLKLLHWVTDWRTQPGFKPFSALNLTNQGSNRYTLYYFLYNI